MTTVAHAHRFWRPTDVRPLAWLPPLLSQWRRRRRAAATRRELQALDDHQLHDIGLARSEIDSLSAELAGLAEPSRVRSRHVSA